MSGAGGNAARLAVAVAAAAVLLSGAWHLTRDRIVEQQRRAQLQSLNEVVPQRLYDNDLLDDVTLVADEALGGPEPRKVHRARSDGQPVAVILPVTAPEGYNGPIELLVGVRYDGVLSGVRVSSHRETAGLGDSIDTRVSDWIYAFDGRSLGEPDAERWTVRRDDSAFDAFTGATITPSAVVTAVRRALEYFEANRDALFSDAG